MNPDPRKGLPSASKAESYFLCPGKFRAEKDCYVEPSDFSAQGTATHQAFSQVDSDDQTAELAREIESETMDRLLPGETYTRVVNHRLFGHDPETMRAVCTGELDTYFPIVGKDVVVIQDLKSLYGEQQEAPENLQLRWYAALLWEQIRPAECYVFINQPLVTRKPVVVGYTSEQLEQSHAEMITLAKLAQRHGLARTPGHRQCKFCAFKERCPERAAWLADLKPAELRALPAAEWAPDQWALFLERVGELEDWIAIRKAMAKAKVKADPNAIPGWTLGKAKTLRPVTDPDLVWERLFKLGVSLEDFRKAVKISKECVKPLVKAATKFKGSKLDEAVNKVFEGATGEMPCEAPLERKKEP